MEIIEKIALDDDKQEEPIEVDHLIPIEADAAAKVLSGYLTETKNENIVYTQFLLDNAYLLEKEGSEEEEELLNNQWKDLLSAISSVQKKVETVGKIGIISIFVYYNDPHLKDELEGWIVGQEVKLVIFNIQGKEKIPIALFIDANGVYHQRTERFAIILKKIQVILLEKLSSRRFQFQIPNKQALNPSYTVTLMETGKVETLKICQWVSLILVLRFIIRAKDKLNAETFQEICYEAFQRNLSQNKLANDANRIYHATLDSKNREIRKIYSERIRNDLIEKDIIIL